MTNPTLERAVSALKAEIGKAFDAKPLPFAGDTGNWSARGNMQELDLEVCVRAVLMAVRIPDKDILKAAEDLREWEGGFFHEPSATDSWPAMIDKILSDD